MCCIFTPAIVLKSSPERWIDVPLPDEPNDSGDFFASSISSFTLDAGTDLFTTSRLGVDARKVIGVKSLMWLYGIRSYSAALMAWVPTVPTINVVPSGALLAT